MSIHDRQARARRLSYLVGGISFKGFIFGMILLITGILLIKFFGNQFYIPEILVGVVILSMALGVIVELLTFIVAVTE